MVDSHKKRRGTMNAAEGLSIPTSPDSQIGGERNIKDISVNNRTIDKCDQAISVCCSENIPSDDDMKADVRSFCKVSYWFLLSGLHCHVLHFSVVFHTYPAVFVKIDVESVLFCSLVA